MNPKVSIIIPVYNGGDYLREAIESALSQTYKNVEIIVVNDGSCDDNITRKIALSFGNRIIYYEKENGGVSSALNYGIERMTGDYFSWLSHDDLYLPNKLEKQVDAIKKSNKKDVAVYSDFTFLKMPEHKVVKRQKMSDRFSEKVLTSGIIATSLWLIYGCSLLIPKNYFEERGLFNEEYRYIQDYLMWFELFHDREILFVDDVLVYARIHANQQGKYLQERGEQEKQEVYSYIMNLIIDEKIKSNIISRQQLLCLLIERSEEACAAAFNYGRGCLKLIENIEETKKAQNAFSNKLSKQGNNYIYIYGAGIRGKLLYSKLKRRNISVKNFIDQNEELWEINIEGIECIGIDNVPKEKASIIVSISEAREIVEWLLKLGFSVCTYDDLVEQIMLLPFLSEDIVII